MSNETTFTFRSSKYLLPMMNIGYNLLNINEDYDEEGDFEVVMATNIPTNIYDCIDETGCLDDDADGFVPFRVEDIYVNESEYLDKPYFDLLVTPIDDYNGGFTIELESGKNDIQIKTGDDINELKALFIVRRSNQFVMSFAKVDDVVSVNNGFFTLPFDSKLFGIGYCNYEG